MPLKMQVDEQPTLNLTPMIDVVFQLIVFFMVGTRFASVEHKIGVKVPQVAESVPHSATPPKHVVHVKKDGGILFDSEEVTLEGLAGRLSLARGKSRDVSVVVRGDGEGAFQSVAAVLATCRKAGITDLGISVKVATSKHVAAGGGEESAASVRR